MARAVVTGASGFIGRHVVQCLIAAGDDVSCLVRDTSQVEPLAALGVRLVRGDVRSPETLPAAVADTDVVYHLAGVTKAARRRAFFDVNEHGTAYVADACAARQTPPVLVIVSSLAAAGPSPEGRSRHEADPARPVSIYGRSKRAGELAAEGRAARTPITVVRPPIVFGPGDRDALAWFKSVAGGWHLVPGFAERRFSLIYATDLAEGLRQAALRGKRLAPQTNGEAAGYYFISGTEQPTYADLGRLIATALDKNRVRVVRVPEIACWLVAASSQVFSTVRGKPAILNVDKIREGTAGSWVCHGGRAAVELGFSPGSLLGDRLRDTAAWYRQHGWL